MSQSGGWRCFGCFRSAPVQAAPDDAAPKSSPRKVAERPPTPHQAAVRNAEESSDTVTHHNAAYEEEATPAPTFNDAPSPLALPKPAPVTLRVPAAASANAPSTGSFSSTSNNGESLFAMRSRSGSMLLGKTPDMQAGENTHTGDMTLDLERTVEMDIDEISFDSDSDAEIPPPPSGEPPAPVSSFARRLHETPSEPPTPVVVPKSDAHQLMTAALENALRQHVVVDDNTACQYLRGPPPPLIIEGQIL